MAKPMKLDGFMADTKRSGKSDVFDWKKEGETTGFLHPDSDFWTRKVWFLPVWRQVEKVVKKVKTKVWQQSHEMFISPNEERGDDKDPIQRFKNYLNENEDIDDTDVVYTVGTGKNKVEYTKGELLGVDESAWKKKLSWRQEYLLAWVPTVKTNEAPVVISIPKGAGKKFTKVIEAEIKDHGSKKGNPFSNPYAFELSFDKTETTPGDMYNVRVVHNVEVDEDIQEAFEKDVPDLEALASPTDPVLMYKTLMKYISIDIPEGVFDEWEGVEIASVDDEVDDVEEEEAAEADEADDVVEEEEPEEADEAEADEEEEAEVDPDDIDAMDRAALKAYIKEKAMGFRVGKKMTDDDIREKIQGFLGQGTDDEPEADEDDEVDDTVEEAEAEAEAEVAEDEVDLDDMSRKELKALIKEDELDVKVVKSMSDDDIRALIAKAYEAAAEADEGEDEEAEADEPDEDEDEGVDLDELDRKGLKALIKENGYDIKVTKSMTDDKIRELIGVAAEAGDEAEEGDEVADAGDLDPCPQCQKMIPITDMKCKYCGAIFE